MVIASLGISLRKCLVDSRANDLIIAFDTQTGWSLADDQGRVCYVELLGSSVATVLLTVLLFQEDTGKHRSIPVFPDSLDAESYRQLRVLLKILKKEVPTRSV